MWFMPVAAVIAAVVPIAAFTGTGDPPARAAAAAPAPPAPEVAEVAEVAEFAAQRTGPRCFGAASRDAARPCRNASLRLRATPTPAQARSRPNAPCTLDNATAKVPACEFGIPADRATATIGLIGDSHASHWRAAVGGLAADRGWRGLSTTKTGCSFSTAIKALPDKAQRDGCLRWNRAIPGWFRRHPEVSTVFASQISGGAGVVGTSGRAGFEAKVAGHLAAWKRLPRSVKRIVVLRDTPKADGDTDTCVERMIARRRPAGAACAVPRGTAFERDAVATAAARYRSDRASVVDLTRFFCGVRTCPAVIGGALVYKDQNHMTATFGETLAPYLARAYDGLAG